MLQIIVFNIGHACWHEYIRVYTLTHPLRWSYPRHPGLAEIPAPIRSQEGVATPTNARC